MKTSVPWAVLATQILVMYMLLCERWGVGENLFSLDVQIFGFNHYTVARASYYYYY